MILGLPLGLRFQEAVTVSGDPEGLEVVEITRHDVNPFGNSGSDNTVHYVRTRG
jgi:hypothetical protein